MINFKMLFLLSVIYFVYLTIAKFLLYARVGVDPLLRSDENEYLFHVRAASQQFFDKYFADEPRSSCDENRLHCKEAGDVTGGILRCTDRNVWLMFHKLAK